MGESRKVMVQRGSFPALEGADKAPPFPEAVVQSGDTDESGLRINRKVTQQFIKDSVSGEPANGDKNPTE